jgi:hypothetical protein
MIRSLDYLPAERLYDELRLAIRPAKRPKLSYRQKGKFQICVEDCPENNKVAHIRDDLMPLMLDPFFGSRCFYGNLTRLAAIQHFIRDISNDEWKATLSLSKTRFNAWFDEMFAQRKEQLISRIGRMGERFKYNCRIFCINYVLWLRAKKIGKFRTFAKLPTELQMMIM